MSLKFSKILLVCIAVIFRGTEVFSQNIISGEVLNDKSKPVQGAGVYLDNTLDGATTDSTGFFRFTTTQKGNQTLIITNVGYEKISLNLTVNGNIKDLVIKINPSFNYLQQVTITAGSFDVANDNKTVLKPMDIMTTAGASTDVVKAIETLPGTQQPGATTGLFVRGGDASETAIIMDGMVVQNAFFSSLPGVSQSSRFSPFQFKGISFSSGAYSARYGQALSSVLELNTLDVDDKNKISIGANITGIYTSGDNVWENSSLGFAAYYNNLSPFYGLAKSNVYFFSPPVGNGLSVRYVYKPNKNGLLKILVNGADYNAGLKTPDPFIAGDSTNFNIRNTTIYTNVSYKQQIKDKWTFYTAASYSHNKDNISWSDVALGSIPLINTDYRLLYRLEAAYYFNNWFSVLEGMEIQHYGYSKLFDTLNGKFTENLIADYVEVNLSPVNWVAIRSGLRYEHSGLLQQGVAEPRFSLAVKTGSYTQISLATGTFYEYPDNRYLLSGYRPAIQEAIHYIANFQWMQSDRTLRVEGYYKDYKSLVKEYTDTYDPNEYRFIEPGTKIDNSGYGYAKGVELFWRDKKSIKDLDYWISYSYIDTKRLYEDFLTEATPNFVSKNNLNIVTKYFVEKWQTNFSLTYTYASGRPYYNSGSIVFLGDKTPEYNNVALSIGHLTRIKNWFTVIYFGIGNLTDQHNLFGYRYSIDGLRKYPVLPALYRTFIFGFNFSLSQFSKNEL